MFSRPRRILCTAAIALSTALPVAASPQDNAPKDSAAEANSISPPLPDIATLLARVRSRYVELESLRKNYIFTVTQIADEFARDGSKKTHTDEYEAFFVNGTQILQHVSHDGKPLAPGEARKEQARVDKQVQELRSGHRRKEDLKLSASGLLKVASFGDPRREMLNGRPTLVFDYKGDPHAHADGPAEEVMRLLAGTLWVDERDTAIVRLNGTLQENFHLGGGLLVNIRKGSWFDFVQAPVNGEIWFPHEFTAHVDGRVLLVKGFDGDARQSFSDYRKLRTTVTILPGSRVVDGADAPAVTGPSEPLEPTQNMPSGSKP